MLVSKQGQNLPIHACGYLWHQKYNIVNKNHTRCVFHLLPIVYYKIFLGLHSTILHRKYWVQNVHRTYPGFLPIDTPRMVEHHIYIVNKYSYLPYFENDLFLYTNSSYSLILMGRLHIM